MRHRLAYSLIVLMLVTVLSAQTRAPKPAASDGSGAQSGSQQSDPQFGNRRNAANDPEAAERESERARERNKERFTSLKKDTDRLLSLAQELKEQVDKSGEHTLSLDVIKKTDEIEKLAKKVREKMKGE